MYRLLVLSLAVLGASALPCCNTVAPVCGPALAGRNIFSQTPIIENPTRIIPSCIPQTSVSQSCHCLKTIVRPQIRNEVITVPEVDRIVRVVPSSVVEVSSYNVGGDTRTAQIPTCGVSTGVVGGVLGGVSNGVVGGVLGGVSNGVVGGVLGGVSTGVVGGVLGEVTTGVVNGVYPGFGGVVGGSCGLGGVVSVGNTGCGCGSTIIA